MAQIGNRETVNVRNIKCFKNCIKYTSMQR